jgi:hypothetical protein
MSHLKLLTASVLGLAVLIPMAASAAEWGAIAYDAHTGRIGYSWHGTGVEIAKAAALKACGTAGCAIVIDIGPGLCGALATAPNPTGWGAASRSTRANAELGAMADCEKANHGVCKVQNSDCNQ